MKNILAFLFILSLQVLLSVLIMVRGWGLVPRSWGWIIIGGVIGHTVLTWLLRKVIDE